MVSSKELKEKIINSLSEWKVQEEKIRFLNQKTGEKISFSLFNEDDLQEAKQSIIEYPKWLKTRIIEELLSTSIVDSRSLKEINWTLFDEKSRRVIKQAMIDNIKRYDNEWEIKKIRTLDFGGRREDETVLIHQSAQVNYDEQGFLIREHGKIYFKNEFSSEEWKDLESVVRLQAQQQQSSFPWKQQGNY